MDRWWMGCLGVLIVWGCGEGYRAPGDVLSGDGSSGDGISTEPLDTMSSEEGGAEDLAGASETTQDAGPEEVAPDSGSGDAWEPDPAFLYAVREHPDRQPDDPYRWDEALSCGGTPCLEGMAVTALRVDGTAVWAGTSRGLWRRQGADEAFQPHPLGEEPEGPVVDLAGSADGTRMAVVLPDRIWLLDGDGTPVGTLGPLPGVVWTSAAFREDGVLVAGGNQGLFEGLLGGFGPLQGTEGWAVRDLAVMGEDVLTVLQDGALYLGLQALEVPGEVGPARAVVASGKGAWVAAEEGLLEVVQDGTIRTALRPGIGGLPAGHLNAVATGGGWLLIGHQEGASAVPWPLDAAGVSGVQHYVSERWLPSNQVTAVAVESANSLWVGTSGGLARIAFREGLLEDKAAVLFREWMARFWRMDGFLAPDALTDHPWEPTSWRLWDSDNDGLWTQMGIGALCLAYAVTGEEEYYQAARKAMETMFLLIDIPAVDFVAAGLPRGFISRSLVREDEGEVFQSKANRPDRWHPVEYQGRRYFWKDDTSSDETTGHFFGFPLYYDLCAKDDTERAEVAEHAGALARFIVQGGFVLRDLDGQATTFGHWEPERVAITVDGLEACGLEHPLEACLEAEYGGGWLNATEILGHLLAAWHMTGDRFFYDAYDRLVREHRYDEVVTWSRKAITVNNPRTANHSDHELAMLAYATLLRYEPDPERRARYLDGLLGLYDFERPERQPLWAAVVALAQAGVADLPGAIRTLREMPLDHRDVVVDNRHRRDALETVVDRFEDRQWDRVFPYDEIHLMWWNSNPYRMVDGSSPRVRQSPMPFLLAYWMGRYAGIIGAPTR